MKPAIEGWIFQFLGHRQSILMIPLLRLRQEPDSIHLNRLESSVHWSFQLK